MQKDFYFRTWLIELCLVPNLTSLLWSHLLEALLVRVFSGWILVSLYIQTTSFFRKLIRDLICRSIQHSQLELKPIGVTHAMTYNVKNPILA